jgi:hypothetical protein
MMRIIITGHACEKGDDLRGSMGEEGDKKIMSGEED